eukprot:CAMPEP_0195021570 /NCGR_PEP_ID=MMETSP0326_2-20130528/38194_1 /TAXON_ID=2866 ORGANISM="Crypthecodinium cohnii, Strain Seligo" /NCGR_SAMPLE_ID=MMETSP0326_2 /ASSEMBLY_ACC=CAM_ASM_000348 /LENGTH=150 /DNA_ID=CAMNT_0040040831 /DNA_START=203 /DNA_END=655 /DNA_ORIENTATION=-
MNRPSQRGGCPLDLNIFSQSCNFAELAFNCSTSSPRHLASKECRLGRKCASAIVANLMNWCLYLACISRPEVSKTTCSNGAITGVAWLELRTFATQDHTSPRSPWTTKSATHNLRQAPMRSAKPVKGSLVCCPGANVALPASLPAKSPKA